MLEYIYMYMYIGGLMGYMYIYRPDIYTYIYTKKLQFVAYGQFVLVFSLNDFMVRSA